MNDYKMSGKHQTTDENVNIPNRFYIMILLMIL